MNTKMEALSCLYIPYFKELADCNFTIYKAILFV